MGLRVLIEFADFLVTLKSWPEQYKLICKILESLEIFKNLNKQAVDIGYNIHELFKAPGAKKIQTLVAIALG